MLLLLLPLKNGLLRHRGLQGLECLPDNLSADIHLFLMSQGRIAERMGDRNGRNNPVRSNRQGNRYDRGNMNHRNTISFNCFNHRCTATSTGPSGGGQDHGVHMVVNQLLSDFLRIFRSVGNACSIADRCIEILVKAPDFSFL